MKAFFELTDDYRVVVTPWMMFVPEFSKLIKADKGSDGDYRGEKKLRSTKQLAFIWFMISFASPIEGYDEDEKRVQALRYTGLTEDDINEDVKAAMVTYDKMQLEAARVLKTLRAIEKAMDKMDEYYDKINFADVDKLGRLKNSTESFNKNVGAIQKTYENIEFLRKTVMAQLKEAEGGGVRGKNSKLGGKEGTRESWEEKGNPKASKRTWVDLQGIIIGATGEFNPDEVTDELSEKEGAE